MDEGRRGGAWFINRKFRFDFWVWNSIWWGLKRTLFDLQTFNSIIKKPHKSL